jgi:hypothetical protein
MSALLRRLVASLALAAFVGTLALPFGSASHLSWSDDADCVAPVGHGPRHATTAFRDAGAPLPTGHCPLCHWLRAFAGASLTPVRSSTPLLGVGAANLPPLLWWHGRDAALDRPSRAPPSSSIL